MSADFQVAFAYITAFTGGCSVSHTVLITASYAEIVLGPSVSDYLPALFKSVVVHLGWFEWYHHSAALQTRLRLV